MCPSLARPARSHRSTWNPWKLAWRCAILSLALLGALPLAVARGGGAGAIMLRYQFAPGEHFAYRLVGFVRLDVTQVGQAPSSRSVAVEGVISYRVVSVSPSGVASAIARIESSVITQTVNGQSKVTRTDSSEALLTAQRVQLGPDNSLPGRKGGTLVLNSYGNYGLQAIGALPAYPVAPGQHWPSSATSNLASGIDSVIPPLPDVRLVADNTMLGERMDSGVPVAAMSSRSVVNYATDTTQAGSPVHVRATGSLAITSLFDLMRKRLYASIAAIDITYTVTAPLAEGGHLLARTHFVDDATLRPTSITG